MVDELNKYKGINMSDKFDTDMDDSFDELDSLLGSDIPGLEDPTEDMDNVSLSVVTDFSSISKRNINYDKVSASLRKSVTSGLPANTGDTLDKMLDAKDTITEGLDKNLETIKKATVNTLGGIAEVAPDFIANPAKKLRNWLRDESYSSDRELSEDEKIANELTSILGEVKQPDVMSEHKKAVIDEYRNKQSNELLANIVANTKIGLDLKYDIDNKYYRKDLELQMKQTLTLTHMLDIMRTDSEIRTKQLEAIVKNTGLPDFAKNRSSDFVKQMLINQASDVGLNAFKSTSVYNKAAKNISNLINDKVATFVTGTEQLNTVTDMMQMNREMGINPLVTVTDMLVGKGVDKVTKAGTDKIVRGLLSNDKGQKTLEELDKLMSDPSRAISELSEQSQLDDPTSKKARLLELLNEVTPSSLGKQSYTLHNKEEVNQASFIDNKLKTSMVTVIPNLLSNILLEVKAIRTGSTTVDKQDRTVFDYSTNTFKTKKELTKETDDRFIEKGKSLVNSVNNNSILDKIADKLNKEERLLLSSALAKYLSDGKSPSPYYLLEDGLLSYIDNPRLRNKVKLGIKDLTRPKSTKEYETVKELQDKLTNLQLTSVSNHSDIVNRLKDTTDTEIYKDFKLVNDKNPTEIGSDKIADLNKRYVDKATEQELKKLESKTRGFSTGGYTGDGSKNNEIKGVIHEEEFAINKSMLKGLISDIKNTDIESITKTVTDIAKDVTSESKKESLKIDVDKSIKALNDKVSNIDTSSIDKVIDKFNNVKSDTVDSTVVNNISDKSDIVNSVKGTFKKLGSKLNTSSMVTSLKTLFVKTNDAGKDIDENMSKINDIITNQGLDSVISKALLGVPYPKNYSEAVYLYRKVFNTIDPSGESWDKVKDIDNFIENIQKLHIKLIEDRQKGLLGRFGEKLDDGLDGFGNTLTKLRDNFITMLPANLQPMARNILDNRFTKLGGTLVTNLKKAFKGAGKATLSGLRDVGGDIRDTFIDKDGKLHLPNLIDLTKLAGKTYFGTAKALSKGVKELYPALYTAGKETVKTGLGTAWDMLGVEKTTKKIKNRLVAKVKPPIERKLYTAWTSGKMTASEVMDLLSPEDKIVWEKWLAESTRPGLTLPDMLMTTGRWYVDAIIGTSKVIKPTYSKLGKATKGATKLGFKAVWSFSGIPDLFKSDKHKAELRFIDIISDGFKDTLIDSINTIVDDLGIDTTKLDILYKLVPKNKSKSDKQLIKMLRELNTLYITLNETKDLSVTNKINDKIVSLLTYLDKTTASVKTTSEIKDKKQPKKKGFKSGGYTGDVDTDEVAGETHGREYVVNNNKLKTLISSVRSFNKDAVFNKVRDIANDVTAKSKEFGNRITNINKDTISDKYAEYKDKTTAFIDTTINKINETLLSFKNTVNDMSDTITDLNKTIKDLASNINKKYSPFDLDKDGDRDGNAIDRFKKLYGDDKKDEIQEVVVRDENTKCWGGTSCLKKLMLGISAVLGGFLLFKNTNVAAIMSDVKDNLMQGYRYIKYLPEGIGLEFRNILSKLHLGKAPTKDEWRSHNDKVMGIDSKKIDKIKEDKDRYVSEKVSDWEKKYIVNANKIKSPEEREKYLSRLDEYKRKVTNTVSKEYDDTYGLTKAEREYISKDEKVSYLDKEYDAIDYAGAAALSLPTAYLANKAMLGIPGKLIKGTANLSTTLFKKAFNITTAKDIEKMTHREYDAYKASMAAKEASNLSKAAKATSTTTKAVKDVGILGKVWNGVKYSFNTVKKAAVSVYELKLPKKLSMLLTKIRKVFGKAKTILIKRLGKRQALKVFGKFASKFLPGLGTALLVYDLYKIYTLTTEAGMTLLRAVLYQIFGIDINEDEVNDTKVVDEIHNDTVLPTKQTDTINTPPIVTAASVAMVNKERTTTAYSASKKYIKSSTLYKDIAEYTGKLIPTTFETALSPKLKITLKLVRGVLARFESKLIEHYGKKEGKRIATTILSRFIPGLGTALLAFDLARITYLHEVKKIAIESAVSIQMLGIDIFNEETAKTDKYVNKTTDDYYNKAKAYMGKKYHEAMNYKAKEQYDKYMSNIQDFKDRTTAKFNTIKNETFDKVQSYTEDIPKRISDVFKPTLKIPNLLGGDLYSSIHGYDNIILGKNAKINGMLPAFKNNLLAMANEYNFLTNKKLPINSGYRSYEDQVRLKKKYGPRAATPGNSTHELGFAFDTNTTTANELDKLGLMAKYGFTRPVGRETWHVEPALVQLDLYKARKDLQYANNLIKESIGKGGSGWATDAKSKKSTRNKEYQELIINNVIHKKPIPIEVLKDKPVIEKYIKQKDIKVDTTNNSKDIPIGNMKTTKPHKVRDIPINQSDVDNTPIKVDIAPKKSNTTIVKLDTSHIENNSKELNTIKEVNLSGNSILEKSLKVQYSTYERIGELVDVNKSMLEVLKGNKPNTSSPRVNNKHYDLPSYDSLIKNNVENF